MKLAGTLVAEIGAWKVKGDAGGYLGKAKVARVNTYYINHGTGFTISLGRALRGICISIALEGNVLHFHMKRKRGGVR